MTTNIQWTDETWLMWPGCVPASAGCANCYAVRDGWRLSYNPNPKVSDPYAGIVKKVLADGTEILGGQDHPRRSEGGTLKFTGATRFIEDRLAQPLRWKKPRRVFVSANSDLFLPSRVATETGRRQIAAVFGVMAACPQHTFQVLTKWPDKAREWFAWLSRQSLPGRSVTDDELDAPDGAVVSGWERSADEWVPRAPHECLVIQDIVDDESVEGRAPMQLQDGDPAQAWPLPNVHIGTSVEDQPAADRRIPELLHVPAVLRFLSVEPLIGPVDLGDWSVGPDQGATAVGSSPSPAPIDWVIVGGESGPKARDCEVAWIRSVVEQCQAAQVPVFVKQLGARPLARSEDDLGPEAHAAWDAEHAGEPFPLEGYYPKIRKRSGSDPAEWPEDLRVREMPT